ncbi:MAG: lysophospholipid acyltransferase family protein [Burkholderiaceae bacterium]|nr:lysophospholipid acyltransferase family protein [Burkholderiaceae bacterium]MCD8536543.1 lysophospholipid acyltransferase family protein [Burkholderiaceae bacterium]
MTERRSPAPQQSASRDTDVRSLRSRSLAAWLLVTTFELLARAPMRVRLALGSILAKLAPILMRRRTKIAQRNIELCFADKTPKQREKLLKDHLRALVQSFIDRSVIWFGSPADIEDFVTVSGLEHAHHYTDQQQPIMLLAPHFIGLDAAASRLTLAGPEGGTIYAEQRNKLIDDFVRLGRGRFHNVHLISRKDGVRGLVRLIKQGMPIYYLPDMDLGRRGAALVPFFGVPAYTQTATAQLARQFNLPVLPVVSTWDPATGKYHVQILPPLTTFPDPNKTLEEDTAHLNELLEQWIEPRAAQYYWVHRRFKSHPPGQPSPYES